MKLIYRGTTFNYNPANTNTHRSVKPIESAYELIYRGQTYRVEPTAVRQTAIKLTEYELICRSTTYQVKRNEQGEVITMISCLNRSNRKVSANYTMQKATDKHSIEM